MKTSAGTTPSTPTIDPMKIQLQLLAEFEVPDDSPDPLADARRQLDAFREAVLPASEYGIVITVNDDPGCYFECDECGRLKTVPLHDVKQVGHPMCSHCDDEMSEIDQVEYLRAERDRGVNGWPEEDADE